MPLAAIDRRLWVPDEVVLTCHSCCGAFDKVFRWRHHCRRCGLVFCGDCCRGTLALVSDYSFGEPAAERACDGCIEAARAPAACWRAIDRRLWVPDEVQALGMIVFDLGCVHTLSVENGNQGVQ